MAVAVPHKGIWRAKSLLGARRGEEDACLACGKPIGAERAVRLHGDGFHHRCALYVPRRQAAS